MSFECLCGALCFVGSFVERCDHLPFNLVGIEVVLEGSGVFVIKYLDSDVVAIVAEPTVSSGVGLLQGGSGAGGHGFDVDIFFCRPRLRDTGIRPWL